MGPDRQRFTVYKDEICSRSEFFKAACSERWTKEEQKEIKVIELQDDESGIFDVYLHCVFKDKVDVGDVWSPFAGEPGEPDSCLDTHRLAREKIRLIKTYILADKLRDPISANIIIDDLMQFYDENSTTPNSNICAIIANNTTTESPLWRLAVDYITCQSDHDALQAICGCEMVPRAFICGVLLRKSELLLKDKDEFVRDVFVPYWVFNQDKCRYHQHDELHPSCGEGCSQVDKGSGTDDDSDAEGDSDEDY